MALDLLAVLDFLGLDEELLGLDLLFFLVFVLEWSPDKFFFDFLLLFTGTRCKNSGFIHQGQTLFTFCLSITRGSDSSPFRCFLVPGGN